MTAETHIEEKALHWFVTLRDETALESAWLDFHSWLEASPDHARAYDAVERLWVDLDAADAAAIGASPVIDLSAARERRARRRSPWLGAGLGIMESTEAGESDWQCFASGCNTIDGGSWSYHGGRVAVEVRGQSFH